MLETPYGSYKIIHYDGIEIEENIITLKYAIGILCTDEPISVSTDVGIFEAQRISIQPQPVVFPEIKMSLNFAIHFLDDCVPQILHALRSISESENKTDEKID